MAILVNGERIEDEAIRQEMEQMRPALEEAFADEPPAEREARLAQWARENAIERVLLNQEARADARPVPEEAVREALEAARREAAATPDEAALGEEVRRRLKVARLLAEAGDRAAEPTEEDIGRFYEEHRAAFTAPERVHAAHIVKHVSRAVPPEVAEAAVRQAREELAAGADFAETARRHSDCPENGGDLGWFPEGRMVEEFDRVVWTLKPGETSDVFATRFGFHVVRVHDRRPAGPMTLDEVREVVEHEVRSRLRDEAVERCLDGLLAKARVEEA